MLGIRHGSVDKADENTPRSLFNIFDNELYDSTQATTRIQSIHQRLVYQTVY